MKLLFLNIIAAMLYSGCSGVPLPRWPQNNSMEFKAPDVSLFPVNRRAGLSYDTRTIGDATETELNSILRGNLKGKGKIFLKYSKKYKISARFASAVSIAESGSGSRVSRRYNNYFGLMRGGRPISFKNSEACIEYFFQTISKYHLQKRYTVLQIQKKYCPVRGGEWKKNVLNNMNKIK